MSLKQKLSEIVGSSNVLDSKSELAHYGNDWTKAPNPSPSLIVFPKSTNEVSRVVKACEEARVAIVPSGGRTGLSGGAVAYHGEVVLSLEKMNQIFEINTQANTLHCQAGVVLEAIQKACVEKEKYFPLDFASKGSSLIGGNIATNAGGVKVIRYGLTRDLVLGLVVVTSGGEILNLNGTLQKNNTGYDLRQLFIGSEGTLGVICECYLKIVEPPPPLETALLALPEFSAILKVFDLAKKSKITLTAFEFFGARELEIVLAKQPLQSPFKETHPFYVLLEAEKTEGFEAKFQSFVEKCFEENLLVDALLSQNSQQSGVFWKLRETISESISATTLPHKNDISLPVEKIVAFMDEFSNLAKRLYPEFEIALFGHIGDGNIHVNILKPENLSREKFLEVAKAGDPQIYGLVQKFGGSISAEHGIGTLKKDYLGYSRSPIEIALMKKIKKAFDPNNTFNPGKVLDP